MFDFRQGPEVWLRDSDINRKCVNDFITMVGPWDSDPTVDTMKLHSMHLRIVPPEDGETRELTVDSQSPLLERHPWSINSFAFWGCACLRLGNLPLLQQNLSDRKAETL